MQDKRSLMKSKESSVKSRSGKKEKNKIGLIVNNVLRLKKRERLKKFAKRRSSTSKKLSLRSMHKRNFDKRTRQRSGIS